MEIERRSDSVLDAHIVWWTTIAPVHGPTSNGLRDNGPFSIGHKSQLFTLNLNLEISWEMDISL